MAGEARVSAGIRGADFYAHMGPEEFAAHQARDNGDLSEEMKAFDAEIKQLEGLDRVQCAELRLFAKGVS